MNYKHRYEEALADADQAVTLGPAWDKAHFRRGSALKGLHRNPQATLAFCTAWRLNPGRLFEACFVGSEGGGVQTCA